LPLLAGAITTANSNECRLLVAPDAPMLFADAATILSDCG